MKKYKELHGFPTLITLLSCYNFIAYLKLKSSKRIYIVILRTCDPIVTENDISSFYAAITGNFQGAVQYNRDNRGFEVILAR